MNKRLALTTIILIMTSVAFCQDLLDTDKYKDAEIFVVKKGYDVQQRLEEIKSIAGKEVTVYQV
ncbi:MAG: hypothetical protein QM762_13765 [Chryseolinea sp.]